MEAEKKLTLFEASSVVAGLGVGGGVMAVPYLASLNGIATVAAVMVSAYIVSLLLHLMVAEVVLRDEKARQLVEIFGKYLFVKSWWGSVLTWLFFGLIVVTFYSLLAAYLVGCAELIEQLTGLPVFAGEVVTYAIAAGVVFFGLKAIGLSEKYAVIGIAAVLVILSVGSLGNSFNPIPFIRGGSREVFAFYGMLMFSFACFFSVPQAVEGLSWNKKLVPYAVAIGIAINLCFAFVITLMSMLVSKEVTEVAILGWGEAVGGWALVLGAVFAFLAMMTSYWAVSYALAVILEERLNWGYRASWLAATFPTLILALVGIAGFRDFLRYAGGAMAVLVALLIVPALRKSRRLGEVKDPAFDMGIWGTTTFQLIVIAAYVLMAIGSVVPVGEVAP